MRVFAIMSLLLAVVIPTTISSGGIVNEEINKERRSTTQRYHRNSKNSPNDRIALEELTDNKNNKERINETAVTINHLRLRGGFRVRNRTHNSMSKLAEKAVSATAVAKVEAEKAEERLDILAEKATQRNDGNLAEHFQETVKKRVKRTRKLVSSPRSKLMGSTLNINNAITMAQTAAKNFVDSIGCNQGGDDSKRFRVDNDEPANELFDKGLAKIYSGGRGNDGLNAARARTHKSSKSESSHSHSHSNSHDYSHSHDHDHESDGSHDHDSEGTHDHGESDCALDLASLTSLGTAALLIINTFLNDDVPTPGPTRSPIGTPTAAPVSLLNNN